MSDITAESELKELILQSRGGIKQAVGMIERAEKHLKALRQLKEKKPKCEVIDRKINTHKNDIIFYEERKIEHERALVCLTKK